jgi:glutathione S-transferase
MAATESPKVILYTNHTCPWAHRAHVALSALGVPFTESIVDLDTPRTPEYLAINPRGLVPTLSYNGVLIPESGIVTQFLADTYADSPKALEPASNTVAGALARAQIAFFVDAFVSKVVSNFYAGLRAKTDEEKNESADKLVAGVVKEVEPLLQNANPFFNGSETITLAEVSHGVFSIV